MYEYKNATPFTYVYDKFEYFAEDFDCTLCAHYNKRGGNGCGRSACEYQDLKDNALLHERIKRPRGWRKTCLIE